MPNQNTKEVLTYSVDVEYSKDLEKRYSYSKHNFKGIDKNSMGYKIKMYRKNNNLFIKDLTKILDCDRNVISHWEKNITIPNKSNKKLLKELIPDIEF